MNHPFRILLALCVLLIGAGLAAADPLDPVKARMKKRLPTIVDLAQRGAVGENNQGQLTPRRKLSKAEKAAVDAENVDRVIVYTDIAKRTGSNPTAVGKQRAAQIRKSAPKGTWIQLPDGKWVQAK